MINKGWSWGIGSWVNLIGADFRRIFLNQTSSSIAGNEKVDKLAIIAGTYLWNINEVSQTSIETGLRIFLTAIVQRRQK